MGLREIFMKDVETKDLHPNAVFRTHYFKNEYNEVKEVVLQYAKQANMNVVNVDDNYGEILVEGGKFDLIISIKRVTVLEHAVDFKVTMKTLLGLNRPAKIVSAYYAYLDKQLRVSGVGQRDHV